jgi:putative peptide zinc metalloprotease protein
MMAISTFSESWHRISGARVGILPTVQAHKQRFRGQDWYVLQDSCSQRFYRITPRAYAFITRLSPNRTIGELWNEFLETHPEEAPGQEEVTQVLIQLHHSNLLYFRTSPDNEEIFERYRKHRQREMLGKALGFMYLRFPLWDPNDWLNRVRPFINVVTGKTTAIVGLVVILLGIKAAVENIDLLFNQSQGLLALDNLIWLYLCMAFLKGMHEMAHAFVCKRFGGNVHTMGIMLLVFAPLPYLDATGSWTFRDRNARALVGAAGLLTELFLAAAGALVWANTAPGLVNSLAFNVMIIGSVSSLLFNGNALLRFDAYYILSDLLEIPNLYQKGSRQWLYFADRYLLGTTAAKSPARDKREWCWLTAYGFLSFFYRLFIITVILLFVADKWPAVAVLFIISTFIMMAGMPAHKLYKHLSGPKVQRNRVRAVSAVLIMLALPVIGAGFIPLPYGVKMPGVVEARQNTVIYSGASGRLEEIYVQNGDFVTGGQPILRLDNRELALDTEIIRSQIVEAGAMYTRALGQAPDELEPIQSRIAFLREREVELEDRLDKLLVRAPHQGEWVGPPMHELEQNWVGRGEVLGEVVDHSALWFTAVVSQSKADELFSTTFFSADLRLWGQADTLLTSGIISLLPYQRMDLPSPVLGWAGGGSIAVDQSVQGGTRAVESFYLFRMFLEDTGDVVVRDGMSGWARVSLGTRPLYQQAKRSLRQLLQKRYRL